MATYFFSGIKHCGKSTHAKLFAKKRNLPFYDLDDLILKLIQPLSVREYYKKEGKENFMKKEYEALFHFLKTHNEDKVIALGGGICDNYKALNLCKKNGTLLFIKVNEKTLYERIILDGIPPFLEGNSKEKFSKLFKKREEIYLKNADLIIEIKDQPIEDTAKDIEKNVRIQEQ